MTRAASALSSAASARSKGARRDHEQAEAEASGALQRRDMGVGGVLDGQATMQELVGLEVRAGEVGDRVVLLGKEAARAEHDRG